MAFKMLGETDAIYINKRKGDASDPYISIEESIEIVQNRIFLKEIPEKYERVKIYNGDIILTEVDKISKIKVTNDYFVDYKLGTVHFDSSMNYVTIRAVYKGIGTIFYPASRIYVDGDFTAESTLQVYIDRAKHHLVLIDNFEKDSEGILEKLKVVNDTVKKTDISKLLENGEYAKTQGNYAKYQGDILSSLLPSITNIRDEAIRATGMANLSSNNANLKINEMTDKINQLEETRQDIVDTVNDANETLDNMKGMSNDITIKLEDITTKVTEINGKIVEINEVITDVNDAKTNTEIATANAITATNTANSTIDIANVAITTMNTVTSNFGHRGEYSTNVNYKFGNIVSLNGNSYMCIVDNKGISPTSDSSKWKLLGLKGDKGDKGIVYRDNYNNTTLYVKDDIVTYNGSTYICINNTTGNLPTVVTYWSLFTSKGADGKGSVMSVNGHTNIVVLTAQDVGALPVSTKIPSKTSEIVNDSNFETIVGSQTKSTNALTDAKAYTDTSKKELITSIDSKSNIGHKHKTVDVDGLDAQLTTFVKKSDVGVINGIAKLNEEGKVIDSEGNLVEGAIKSVNGQVGDVVIEVFSEDYNDLRNKPTLVTSYNQLKDLPVIPVVDVTKAYVDGQVTTLNSLTSNITNTLNGKVNISEKGIPNGVATLNADGKVSSSQIDVDLSTVATKEEVSDLSSVATAHISDDTLHIPYVVASGVANVYTALIPNVNQYTEGMALSVKINVQNTGVATIDVNGLGAKNIIKGNGNAVSSGNLKANSIYTLRYNGTSFILQGEGGEGTALVADVLSGKTFTNNDGTFTGTMANRSGVQTAVSRTVSGTTLRLHPNPGYYPGGSSNSVQLTDSNFTADNIMSGVSIFGLSGTGGLRYYTSYKNIYPSSSQNYGKVYSTNFNIGFPPKYYAIRVDGLYVSDGSYNYNGSIMAIYSSSYILNWTSTGSKWTGNYGTPFLGFKDNSSFVSANSVYLNFTINSGMYFVDPYGYSYLLSLSIYTFG